MYSAPVGSKAAGASFKDMWTWKDVDEYYLDTLADLFPALAKYIASVGAVHSKPMMAYLTDMAQRIIEMHRILKETGSLYLHCDSTASHYLKSLLDSVFGKTNFRNEIVWKRTTAHSDSGKFGMNSDYVLYYTKSNKYTFHPQFQEYSDVYKERFREDQNGRLFVDNSLSAKGLSGGGYQYEFNGVFNFWRCPKETMLQLEKDGKLYFTNTGGVRLKRYLNELPGLPCQTLWTDIHPLNSQSKERTGYPTQKPLALLHRIIKASSNEGDIVLDPFCGCATTCVAAQQLQRKWVGIDIEKQSVKILIERLSDDAGLFKDFVATDQIPKRSDLKITPKSSTVKERLYKQQDGKCKACGEDFKIWNLEIDHIIPVIKGGGDYYENYQLLCGACNKIKGDRPMEYLRMKIEARERMMKNKIFFGE
jgi:site-specific DNA-methyltransferase (adenine-specific)